MPVMEIHTGKIIEISSTIGGHSLVIECPVNAIPAAGQYIQAYSPHDQTSAVPLSLFLGGTPRIDGSIGHFPCSPPVPESWQPGERLLLRGPLGRGFHISPKDKRLALVGLDRHISHILPIVEIPGKEIAIFSDAPLPRLPAHVEAYPLQALQHNWDWADLMLFDGPAAAYHELPHLLDIPPDEIFPCPAQALAAIDMPCGAIAECGICAVAGRRGKSLLACQDGPVFSLSERGLEVQKVR